MKVAVSATEPAVESQVDSRFGRCNYYVFVDTESGDVEAQENQAAMSGSGAGIQAAQFVVEQGAEAIISGHLGPNAYQVLNAAGVRLYRASGMSVQEAVDALEAGTLAEMGDATGPAHMGMSRGSGTRRGSGGSRVGLDRQAVSNPTSARANPSTPAADTASEEEMTPDEELAALRAEVGELRQAVASLLDKVDRLTR
jgi:predicted Fe-Mo cluster-binding NifX family protein